MQSLSLCEKCQSSVLECSSRIELCVKVIRHQYRLPCWNILLVFCCIYTVSDSQFQTWQVTKLDILKKILQRCIPFFFRGDQVPFWESHVPQVCKSTKAHGCTTIGVDLESGWVGSRDVPDLSWIGAWRERDYCRLELFEAAITQFIGSSRWIKYYVHNEGIHGSFHIPNASHRTSFLRVLRLADHLKVFLLATCSAHLAPYEVHPWPITWCSSTMLVTTAASTRMFVELHVKVNSHLSIRKWRLYALRGVPPCAGGLVHSQCVDWLWAQELLCYRAYTLACSLAFVC